MPPVSDYEGPAAGRLSGLLLDIGGVVHNTGVRMVERLARREPAMQPVIEEIGGIASDRDELWQRMLRRQVTERDYWAQRAAELGAAVGETWDTRALMDRFYQLPEHEWLCAPTIELMTDAKAAGLRVGALTNDMTAFHGPEWVARQAHLKLFDVIVDASLTGVMKPDPRAFRGGEWQSLSWGGFARRTAAVAASSRISSLAKICAPVRSASAIESDGRALTSAPLEKTRSA